MYALQINQKSRVRQKPLWVVLILVHLPSIYDSLIHQQDPFNGPLPSRDST